MIPALPLIDAGMLTPYSLTTDFPSGSWGRTGCVVVRGTYYYDSYLSGDSYVISSAKSENIDTYAIRLKDVVDALRARTGADNVTIVAHSMGGLVARRYIQIFGSSSVDQLITVGTPHYGVEASVKTLCPVVGADRECQDLAAGSPFLSKLNDPSRQPKLAVTAIVGKGCDTGGKDGDGVVNADSAALGGADIVEIQSSCGTLGNFHTALLDPETHPEVTEKVIGLIT